VLKRLLRAITVVAAAWGNPKLGSASPSVKGYEPKAESLDHRANPGWFDDEKIGVFPVLLRQHRRG
jgi:hypothetical protein